MAESSLITKWAPHYLEPHTRSDIIDGAVAGLNAGLTKGFGLGTISGVTIPGASRSFTVETFKDDQNLISPSLELFFRGKGGVFFSLNYDGEFGSGYTSNEIMGTIGVFF